MINGIPEVIHDFNMYNKGNKLVGVTGEVSLPDLEAMTETISGAGILGEYEAPVAGKYGAQEMEIPFRCINEDYFRLIDPTTPVALTLRGAEQMNDRATGGTKYVGIRVIVKGRCKKIALGTVKQGGPMDSSVALALTYITIEMDGKDRFELDKINGVYKVNGVDKLAPIKRLT